MTPILPSIARMCSGDHYCGMFRTDEDYRAILVDFVRAGVERNDKILFIVNLMTPDELRTLLATGGVEVHALMERGQLVITTARESYLNDGQFDPDKMMSVLREETDRALAEGYTALRGTGDMTWALAGEPGSERLIEYEARVNQFMAEHGGFIGLCQYDRRRFDAEMLLEIVQTHPHVLYGREGLDNSQMYFVPPDVFLERDRAGATLDTWMKNLSVKGAHPA